MKKLLALVLALVMTLSLCVTSNAAFTDADSIEYKEAVEVMRAIKVLEGDDLGALLTGEGAGGVELAVFVAIKDTDSGHDVNCFIVVDVGCVSIRSVAGNDAEAKSHNQCEDQRE